MMDFSSNSSNLFLAENLRALRKRLGWSQEELADRIGLNRGNIASYERGTAEPKICNLVKFAHFFKIAIFDLTHTDLKEDKAYQHATQRHLNGGEGAYFPAINHYIEEAKEFESAVKGMECIFKMKLREAGELPEDMAFFKHQFTQLHTVAQHLLRSHVELISTVKNKCNEHTQAPQQSNSPQKKGIKA